jgi:hypothetical protein
LALTLNSTASRNVPARTSLLTAGLPAANLPGVLLVGFAVALDGAFVGILQRLQDTALAVFSLPFSGSDAFARPTVRVIHGATRGSYAEA